MADESVQATLHTSQGDILLRLFPSHAPKTVQNFVELAKGSKQYTGRNSKGESAGPYYDGSIFHRVINDFMIQGGDPTGTGRGGPGYNFADEIHPDLKFDKPYRLAMANPGRPHLNGSQFFITVAPTTWLDNKHTIFGEVADASSIEVVDDISRARTGPNDKPIEDIVVERVTIEGS
ncbi:peptidylprolyl isomerase [Streptomyces sp. UH6]|uniref:peptidylprolyl isomerase n=1 Tax=Streptomyces sp. UH6 TaxID=2748379 RepID=UPI0015D4AA15|nr:peptidylprolyl isomerase [Streptomyces sp. UH6]NYV73529.1 peptidylprolyl isomerase [Streptomyces sp. UH6]